MVTVDTAIHKIIVNPVYFNLVKVDFVSRQVYVFVFQGDFDI